MVFSLSGAPPERIRACGRCSARVCGGGACGWCAAFALFQQILVLHGRSLPVVPGLDDETVVAGPWAAEFDFRPALRFWTYLDRALARGSVWAHEWLADWLRGASSGVDRPDPDSVEARAVFEQVLDNDHWVFAVLVDDCLWGPITCSPRYADRVGSLLARVDELEGPEARRGFLRDDDVDDACNFMEAECFLSKDFRD